MKKHVMRKGVSEARCLLAILAATGTLITGGCGKDDDRSKPITKEGRIITIDKDRGVYEMEFFNEEEQRNRKIAGQLDPDVEIIVMGAVAALEDVEVDDIARVTGVAIKTSDVIPTFLVKRVEVLKKGIELPSPATATAGDN